MCWVTWGFCHAHLGGVSTNIWRVSTGLIDEQFDGRGAEDNTRSREGNHMIKIAVELTRIAAQQYG